MSYRKLSQSEFEEVEKDYYYMLPNGIPCSTILPIDERRKQLIDNILKKPNPLTAFYFFFRKYGPPTVEHHDNVLYKYLFLVNEYLVSIEAGVSDLQFSLSIPNEIARPFKEQEYKEYEKREKIIAQKFLAEGIPLLRLLPGPLNVSSLTKAESNINTQNLLVFAKNILDEQEYSTFADMTIKGYGYTSEGNALFYEECLRKVYSKVVVILNKENKTFDEESQVRQAYYPFYDEAESTLLEFCRHLGKKRRLCHNSSYALSIRGIESFYTPVSRK